MNKKQIRNESKILFSKLSIEEKNYAKNQICNFIGDYLNNNISYHTIVAYCATQNEISLMDMIENKFSNSYKIGLPRYVEGKKCYEIAHIQSYPNDLIKGRYGIYEPSRFSPNLDMEEKILWLIPGIAFEAKTGIRVGHGRGYYDQLLQNTKGLKIGICYSFQMLKNLPSDHWDIPMDGIINENEFIRIKK